MDLAVIVRMLRSTELLCKEWNDITKKLIQCVFHFLRNRPNFGFLVSFQLRRLQITRQVAPNGGFLLSTLKIPFRLSRVLLWKLDFINKLKNIFILAALKLQKTLGNICFSEQVFYRKQSLGARDTTPCLFVRLDRFKFLCVVMSHLATRNVSGAIISISREVHIEPKLVQELTKYLPRPVLWATELNN